MKQAKVDITFARTVRVKYTKGQCIFEKWFKCTQIPRTQVYINKKHNCTFNVKTSTFKVSFVKHCVRWKLMKLRNVMKI